MVTTALRPNRASRIFIAAQPTRLYHSPVSVGENRPDASCSRARLLARRLDSGNYRFEPRFGATILLLCAAATQGIFYWYPMYVCARYSAPDDRLEIFLSAAAWVRLGATILAAFGLFQLGRGMARNWRAAGNLIFGVIGVALAAASYSPILLFARFMFD